MANCAVSSARRGKLSAATFPSWDRSGQWQLRICNLPGTCEGRCDPKSRLIRIACLCTEEDRRDKLLIHEICHAVASCCHGVPWLRRMRSAARRAAALGRMALAKLQEEDVSLYEGQPIETAAVIYQQLREWTLGNPKLPYVVLRRAVAEDFGLSPSEFERSYRRSRRVHAQAVREAGEHDLAHRAFWARHSGTAARQAGFCPREKK